MSSRISDFGLSYMLCFAVFMLVKITVRIRLDLGFIELWFITMTCHPCEVTLLTDRVSLPLPLPHFCLSWFLGEKFTETGPPPPPPCIYFQACRNCGTFLGMPGYR
jgi:hypothetical protein